MEPFKNRFTKEAITFFAKALKKKQKAFDSSAFLKAVFNHEWEKKELKERIYHISGCLDQFMSDDFISNSNDLVSLKEELMATDFKDKDLCYNFIPDYIEKYGIEEPSQAFKCFKIITALTTCEFAVRPFYVAYPDFTLEKMKAFAKDDDFHVRRLATEGSRPRLPWGIALEAFKKDPMPILPILELLKKDKSEYVRKSVANNLNDISKDNPAVLKKVMKDWKGLGKPTDKLIKHASRTLLKAGDLDAMKYFGFDNKGVEISKLNLETKKVKIGEPLVFKTSIENKNKKPKIVRLEYALYYLIKNGKHSRKVFKVSEKKYAAGQNELVTKSHAFKVITTRVYYPGVQKVAWVVNGEEFDPVEFELY